MRRAPPFEKYVNYSECSELSSALGGFSEKARQDLDCYGLAVASIELMPSSTMAVKTYSNLSQKWREVYREKNMARLDPLLEHGLATTARLFWDETTLQKSPGFYCEAKKHDFCFGVCQSFRDIFGTLHFFVLLSDKPLPKKNLEGLNNAEDLNKALNDFFLAMLCLLENFHRQEYNKLFKRLSERERTVLYWAASGKTAYKTAELMGISERTVNFHLKSCAKKLGAVNKSQTLLKALSLNLI